MAAVAVGMAVAEVGRVAVAVLQAAALVAAAGMAGVAVDAHRAGRAAAGARQAVVAADISRRRVIPGHRLLPLDAAVPHGGIFI